MYLCLCVCVPPPPIGRCQVTGRPCQCLSAGFLLEQSHCSQHYHKLMSAAQARLNTRPLIPSSDVTRQTQTLSTPKHHLFFCSVTHFCSAQTSFVQHGKKNSHTTEHFESTGYMSESRMKSTFSSGARSFVYVSVNNLLHEFGHFFYSSCWVTKVCTGKTCSNVFNSRNESMMSMCKLKNTFFTIASKHRDHTCLHIQMIWVQKFLLC